MPKNTLKDLQERYAAKQKELTQLRTKFDAAEGDAVKEAREAFDTALNEIEGIGADLARAQKFEQFRDNSGDDGETRTAEELAGMKPGEQRSDKVDPVANPDAKDYRISRVVMAQLEGREINGVEGEIHQELEKRSGQSAKGCMIPMTLQIRAVSGQQAQRFAQLNRTESRELNAATTGTAMLPTILSGNMIDLLRNVAVLSQAGVTVLSGLEGTFELPKVDGSPNFSWGGEGFEAGESSGSINSKVTFRPKTLTGRSKVTRRFMKQALHSFDAENWQRAQLILYHALGLDFAGVNGSGVGDEPLGIFNNPNVGVISMGTDGGPVTFGKTVDMETQVADANAEGLGESCYLTNARVRGQMKQSLKFSAAGSTTIWSEGNTVNGSPAKMSNQIPKDFSKGTGTNLSGLAYGVWDQMVIGLWSGADLLADPFTNGAEGAINLYLHQEADVQNLHDEAFSVAKDVDAQI